jgi:hypothetical protein
MQGVQEVYRLTATTSSQEQAFSNENINQVLINNDGSVPVSLNITSTSAADANHYRLDGGKYVSLATRGSFEGFAVMCTTSSGTGGTSAVQVLAVAL